MKKQLCGIDLHIHTTNSDGTRTIEETIQDALQAGLAHIALTDHNQFAIKQPRMVQGMEIIPGAEFSTAYRTEGGKLLEVHVVGLFFSGVPKRIWPVFEEIPKQRKNYLEAIFNRLQSLGIDISYEELAEEFPDSHQLGRRHIAELLVKKQFAGNVTDAFDRLIGNRSPYWVDATEYMKYMKLEACVKLILDNGGFPILAHPYHYHCPESEMMDMINDFREMAGEMPAGMEVYYSKYDGSRRSVLLKIAQEKGFYPSAASDRHTMEDAFERGCEELLTAMKAACRTGKKNEMDFCKE